MPTYPNRPLLDPETHVWRYLSLAAVVATARDRQLRLTRVDRFPDEFEGSVPKKQTDEQVPLFIAAMSAQATMNQVSAHYPGMNRSLHNLEDPFTKVTRLRRAQTRAAYASCWAAGDESDVLWKLYCNDDGARGSGVGIALRSTMSRLEASVAQHDLYVSPVIYRPYHEGAAFKLDMDPFFHKRRGFAAENEVRLLNFDKTQYAALIASSTTVPEVPEYVFVDWPFEVAVDAIVLSPYVDEAYEGRARQAIEQLGARLIDRVIRSEMDKRRYPPGF